MITRRTFAGALAGGVAINRAKLCAARRLKIGIGTYTYHSLSIEDMIGELTKLDIQEIEMSRVEFMLMERPKAEMFRSVRNKLDRAGIRCVSYYTATIKTDAELDDAIRFAELLGSQNVSGDATGGILDRIDQRFAGAGITFGIHNHWFKEKFAYESAEDVLRALAGRSKTMGSTLDVGQMAARGHDPVDAVRKLGPYLKMVHLKDVEAAGAEHNVLLGTGIVNIPAVIEELHKLDYTGLVAIEYEKEGPVEADVKQQVEYARKLA